jgi:hypothetical protein
MKQKGKLFKQEDEWKVLLNENELTDCKLHPRQIELVERLISEEKIQSGTTMDFYVGIDCLVDCWGICSECHGMEKYAKINEFDFEG